MNGKMLESIFKDRILIPRYFFSSILLIISSILEVILVFLPF